MYIRTVLPNGLRILTCAMPHIRSATLCFYIAAGSRTEPAERAGVAHFLEHMLFKGTARFPTARHISEAIEGVGGVLDAQTSPEVTAYWAKVPADHFPRALELLTDMVRAPLLEPCEIEKERQVIVEELHMVTDSPADWVAELLGEALWPGHPLGRDVAGTEETVRSISRQDLEAYRVAHYSPDRLVVVVAGALPATQVEEAVAAALGDLSAAPQSIPDTPPPAVTAPRLLLRYRECEQAHLSLGIPALSYRHPDRYALLLLDTILGAGMSSRLFLAIREERALAYNVYSALRQFVDCGAETIYAGVAPERAEECLAAVWEELERLAAEGVPEEELERAKEYSKGRILLRMEDSYGVASWYGVQETLLQRIEEVDEVIAHIEAVQPADLQRLAASLFRRNTLCLAAVGPFQDDAPFRRALGIESLIVEG
ncbi:MAG: M16 family metallopeptidase [Chloroflexia bacterium]